MSHPPEIRLLLGVETAVAAALIAKAGPVRKVERDAIVFSPGDHADRVFVVLAPSSLPGARRGPDPQVELVLPTDGLTDKVRFTRIGARELFGELEFGLEGLASPTVLRITRARALTPLELLPIPHLALHDAVEASPILRQRFVSTMVRRLVEVLSTQTVEHHADPEVILANKMIVVAQSEGVFFGNRVRFRRPLKQAELGAMLDLGREQTNHWLNEWERAGILNVGAPTEPLEILDFRRLDLIAMLKPGRTGQPLEISLAQMFQREAQDCGVSGDNTLRVSRTLTIDVLAARLKTNPGAVTAVLRSWQDLGIADISGGGIAITDINGLDFFADAARARDRHLLDDVLEEIDTDLARGDLVRARNIGYDFLAHLPSSPELRHRVALATVRAQSFDEALAVLRSDGLTIGPGTRVDGLRPRVLAGLLEPRRPLQSDASGDDADAVDLAVVPLFLLRRSRILVEDIAVIGAKIAKEQALGAPPDRIGASAAAAASLYEAAYRATRGHYSGINAAMLHRVAGSARNAHKLAQAIASDLGEGATSYWPLASKGEALMLLGDTASAVQCFAQAAAADDASDGHSASTRLQLQRLATFAGLDTAACLAALPVGNVCVYAGHMFRGAEMDLAKQEQVELILRERIRSAFRERRIRYVFGSLACGSDILFAEEAIDNQLDLHIVLPFQIASFEKASVGIGNPPEHPDYWNRRFFRCLEKATSIEVDLPTPPLQADLEGAFFYGFRNVAGRALHKADWMTCECRLLAVQDRHPPGNIAGTSQAVADWLARGRAVDTIEFPFQRKHIPGGARGRAGFRPVAFLWPTRPGFDPGGAAERLVRALRMSIGTIPRRTRAGRVGLGIVFSDFSDALRGAAFLGREPHAPRIICDFGPVLNALGEISGKDVARLRGSADLAGFPPGLLATPSFAMEARYAHEEIVALAPIGRFAVEDARTRSASKLAKAEAAEEIFVLTLRDPGRAETPADRTGTP